MNRFLRMRIAIFGLPLVAAHVAALPADTERQGSVLKRIFSYDKDLRASEKIVILIVAPTRGHEEARDVAAVFREMGLFPAVVGVSDLNDDLTATLSPSSTVVYVIPGADVSAVKEFAAHKGFLSVSAQASLAEEGHVSVSVDVRGDQSQIVINLPRLQTERHELSAELLNLARVIR
ncbi:MAG TPA: hypothetical protein VEK15_05865 [Vicinamibacteria bacterium]|nr:hypothetical protein [Vicinamibacteria bacterium]